MSQPPLQRDVSAGELGNAKGARTALLQILLLAGLSVLLIREDFRFLAMRMFGDSEAAHAIAGPVLIALLVWRRKDLLIDALRPGSLWGIALLGFAIVMNAAFTWPFDIGYPRQFSVVPAVAGSILAIGGWRVLKLCIPMLIILALMIPIGWRQYAFLIVRPETHTLAAAEFALNLLPGVMATLEGQDIYFSGSRSGVIALGDPHRGASLFLGMAMIGAFVTFARVRPFWQIIAVGVFAGPILLICNFLRFLTHGVGTIYGGFDVLSSTPRNIAAIVGLTLAYALFTGLLGVLNNIVEPTSERKEG